MIGLEMDMAVEINFVRYPTVEAGFQHLSQHLLSAPVKMGPILRTRLEQFVQLIAQKMAAKHSGGYSGANSSSDTLQRRSGVLSSALLSSARVTGSAINSIVGTFTLPGDYSIQETGGTIVPNRAKYLAVPLPAALNSNGTPIKQSPRDWNDTFVQKSKAGNLLIFQRRGRQIVPLYVLKTSTEIRPRLGLGKMINADTPGFVEVLGPLLLREFAGA